MMRMVTRCVGLLCGFVLGAAGGASAATPPLTTFNFGASAYAQNPTSGLIYATVPSLNEVVVINPSTLTVQTTIPIGSLPSGLCISPDGSTIYVANSGSNFIGVINTATQTAGTPIFLGAGHTPTGIQIGTNGRLWVALSGGPVSQFDTAGVSTGSSVGGNGIRTSSDHATLYTADYGISPSSANKFDVSGTTPVSLLQMTTGSNGQTIALSANDKLLVATDGSGNNGTSASYADAIYRTSDFAVIGTLPVGPYPGAFAFSPDSLVGYASGNFTTPAIQIYDLTTFLKTATITPTATSQTLFVDQTGQYLFDDVGSTTEVFATGRSVPEPGSLALAVTAMLAVLPIRRRKRTSN